MKRPKRPWLINVFFGVAIAFFLVSSVLPKDTYQHLRSFYFPRVYHLWLLATGLVLLKAYLSFRGKVRHQGRFLRIAPFLLLFLWGGYRASTIPEQVWGVDDAYYYSYLPSVFLDGDLDLSNQYDASGLRRYQDPAVFEQKTGQGLLGNIFPVGCAMFWSPFFLIGHFLASGIELFGGSVALNGYSRPYTQSVVLGNLFFIVCGYYFIFLILRRFYSARIAAIATVAVLITTPYNWLTFQIFHLVSEHLSMALVSFLVWLVMKWDGKWRNSTVFLLGVIAGLITCVRFHNGIFLLLPAYAICRDALGARRTRNPEWKKKAMMPLLILAAGAWIGMLPQLVVWKLLYGEWLVDLASGHLLWWKQPLVLETLFSARKGLFPWAPLTLFSVAGLLVLAIRKGRWGIPFMLIFLLTAYLNASQSDWWGSVSIGARRFVPVSVLFAVGFATLYERVQRKFRRAGEIFLVCVVLFFANMNMFVVSAFARGALQFDHADRFTDVFDEWPRKVYLSAVYPLQLPVQLFYSLRFGTPLYGPLNEFFIGEEILYFQHRAGDELMASYSPLFGKGWATVEMEGQIVRRTAEEDCYLHVPMFYKDRPPLWMELEMKTVKSGTEARVEFFVNGTRIRARKVSSGIGTVVIPLLRRDSISRVNEIRLHNRRASEGTNTPSVELRRIRFRYRKEA